ncbi:SDR family oxidoreductase [Leifsonia poae]|uniref:Dihydroflavonol-4-reductase n=1 Tax=Leifsonia poae TaxID=110933 RepID=A0A9W6LYH6_9MICO|nr:aldehyde reductase [Leifsonia poae]GLJ75178.1 dihydroflavonol-4-reductase [Leifsonia poae]
MTAQVLVTGGSGFVGAHCVLALLNAGYEVRTTIRTPGRAADVRAQLARGGIDDAGDALTFAVADLISDDGWAAAVDGCEYVLHVASPFPATQPKDENDLIAPARDGAMRVLRAARDAGVKRVVQTSSFAAIGYGHQPTDRPFTEEDWTELDSGVHVSAYPKSKTIAERAAWDFIAAEGGVRDGAALELATVNPVGILGPALGSDYSTSVQLVKAIMEGRLPRLPRVSFGVVDVRDVAALHLLAMIRPEALGERFLAIAGDVIGAQEAALLIRGHLGTAGARITTKEMPDWVLKTLAPFSRSVRDALPDIGAVRRASAEKAHRMLGWTPRTREDAIIATVDSLQRLRLEGGVAPSRRR